MNPIAVQPGFLVSVRGCLSESFLAFSVHVSSVPSSFFTAIPYFRRWKEECEEYEEYEVGGQCS